MTKRKPFEWGDGSNKVRNEVHPNLVLIADRALAILNAAEDGIDVSLIDGLRTQAEANANAAKGTGSTTSKHRKQADGTAHAFDFKPVGKSPTLAQFRIIRGAMLQAADELLIAVRSGSDWDADAIETQVDPTEIAAKNIPDFYHLELVASGEIRYLACLQARERRIKARKNGVRWPL